MKTLIAKVVALAVAVAVAPAVAEEPTQGMKRAPDAAVAEDASPPATATAVQHAVQTLQRLRLHPGQDALDVAETARRRPHHDGE